MKKYILGLLTFVFLVVLAPVFAFSMVAPWAVKSILIGWTAIVLVAGGVAAVILLWAHMETRP